MEKLNVIMESYPDKIQAKLERKERLRQKNVPNYIDGYTSELVFEDLKLWRVGTLKVSFKGGDPQLHGKIAKTANKWSEFGNITFDFGLEKTTGKYREWTPKDDSHIRVGFSYNGYWSIVGNDSVDENIVKPGEITLNLYNFDKSLPLNWEGTVLHEFGHALGFSHEHQSIAIECDFDWSKLYEYLGGPPNNWPKWKVDHNMRQLTQGGLSYSAHDIKSIMHYSFPAWMFLTKEKSPCHTTENHVLSDTDKVMAGNAYPFSYAAVKLKDNLRMNRLKNLIAIEKLPPKMVEWHNRHLEYYESVED